MKWKLDKPFIVISLCIFLNCSVKWWHLNCVRSLKRKYAGEAPRGVPEPPSENDDFEWVVDDTGNTTGLTLSPTRAQDYRLSHYYHNTDF